MVADIIKSFDTVGRSILHCVLGRLGLPPWFTRVCFANHELQGWRHSLEMPADHDFYCCFVCPLVWASSGPVNPQVYTDNLKCGSVYPHALFGAARFKV